MIPLEIDNQGRCTNIPSITKEKMIEKAKKVISGEIIMQRLIHDENNPGTFYFAEYTFAAMYGKMGLQTGYGGFIRKDQSEQWRSILANELRLAADRMITTGEYRPGESADAS